ncbi:DNA-directed RNA polymerase subunit alpha C-terminal domain-containing protein [Paenibacillus sp. DMB5]|uniref:DNA-directed RNA polymerase subunit alpha C-terminal domain-containing protein n=1 Tax=Paenibacillus sp. DMB5 TaxID=1780103 RepID=UPI00076CA632|nr:DNA-directed RNA polymerase subunit alpha C-terminal domain-containing protein [Paenibacillus sp. DMB5]KUP20890.1 hypothetical protein AWJ19_06385 [Paenibacillus sp. DMB5]
MKYSIPLRYSIHVPLVFYPFPVDFLRLAALDLSCRSTSRILNSLLENNYITIGDVLNATKHDLLNTPNFGQKGLHVVFDMLETLSRRPELILKIEFLEQPTQDKIERLKHVPPIRKQLLELGILSLGD